MESIENTETEVLTKIELSDLMDFGLFNEDFDEYGEYGSEIYVSFGLCKENNELVARCYCEVKEPGGKGSFIFNIIRLMLEAKANELQVPIKHIGTNAFGNPKVDHLFRKFGYIEQPNDSACREYFKVFLPNLPIQNSKS